MYSLLLPLFHRPGRPRDRGGQESRSALRRHDRHGYCCPHLNGPGIGCRKCVSASCIEDTVSTAVIPGRRVASDPGPLITALLRRIIVAMDTASSLGGALYCRLRIYHLQPEQTLACAWPLHCNDISTNITWPGSQRCMLAKCRTMCPVKDRFHRDVSYTRIEWITIIFYTACKSIEFIFETKLFCEILPSIRIDCVLRKLVFNNMYMQAMIRVLTFEFKHGV